ncbi:MAG: hypothetical protein ACM3PE_11810 [Deltaproteobacteria bacterium]
MLKMRSLLPLLLSLVLAASLTGCSSSSEDASSKKTAASKSAKAISETAKTTQSKPSGNAPGGAGSAIPAMKDAAGPGAASGTRIIGQIASVNDRTVTLALLKMPSPPTDGSKLSAPPSGGTPPSGNQPGSTTPQLSGEKKTVTIPASVKVLSGGWDDSTEVSLSDLKTGQMMEIRLNSSTGTVEEVRVMEQGQGGPPARGTPPGDTSANK